MDRSTHPDGGPVHGEILKLPHNEALFDAIQARNGIVQLHSPQPEILQVDYAARKWPGITWLLDHMCANHDIGRICTTIDCDLSTVIMFGAVLRLSGRTHPRLATCRRGLTSGKITGPVIDPSSILRATPTL